MGSQLFGPLKKETTIKVGYIDPKQGFIGGLTVNEANKQAQKDPGTVFIFKTGTHNLQYLNINEVNALVPQDTLRGSGETTSNGAGSNSGGCSGVNQKVDVGPPVVTLKGGGGIGATGNPIIGNDGSILAVDVVTTGNGYAYPPIVTARDDGNIGNGVVLRAVLGELVVKGDELVVQSDEGYQFNFRNNGSIRGYRGDNKAELYQYYDRADDYEEYTITEEDEIPAAQRWGPNGEDEGEWVPEAWLGGDDPILNEVNDFQDILRSLEGGFFNTRKIRPAKITSNDPNISGDWIFVDDGPVENQYGLKYDDDTNTPPYVKRWSDFMNKYAISPKPPSNTPGSDFAGVMFSFEWNLEFPTTGKYTIRGARDNIAKLYINNEFISDLDSFNAGVRDIKKFYEPGLYNVRLDLYNSPLGTSDNTGTKNVEVFDTVNYQNKADRRLWRTNVYSAGGFLNQYGVCPFDTRQSLDNNPYAGTHVIRWSNVKFPKDGNYIIEIDADDEAKVYIGNASGGGDVEIGNGLRSVEVGGDEVIVEKKGFNPETNKSTGVSRFTKFFKTGSYRIRTELTQKEGGRFTFDTNSNGEIVSNVTARFIRDNGNFKLKVDGSGSAKINFILRTDDNPNQSGSSLRSVKISSVDLVRKKDKSGNLVERETINGSGIFEAGRTYDIKIIGSSSGGGARLSGNDLIEFDDNVDNGFDINSSLKIGKIENLTKTSGKGVNPMAFAMRITSDFEDERKVISRQSWAQNPMGVALTIDAPEPSVPQEPPAVQDGRCPPNPIWTTRSPGSQTEWYPVRYPEAWSNFMDRYAMSPVKPLSEPNTDAGGIQYSNSWDINVEFPGFYGIKATSDNFGSVIIDGQEVYTAKSFKENDPQTKKIYLDEGSHNIEVRVKNETTDNVKSVLKKIFSTQDWQGNSDSLAKSGVSYSGPDLYNHQHKTWSKFMNRIGISPRTNSNNLIGDKTFRWSNVDFPESGRYIINMQSDNTANLFIDGQLVATTVTFKNEPKIIYTNLSKGKYDIRVELNNAPGPADINVNPTGVAITIDKYIDVSVGTKPWSTNPMGISAVLISPPCPRKIDGKGLVTDVIVEDPGNGYVRSPETAEGYPVVLKLKEVLVKDPGINYNCGVDRIEIVPDNGAVLSYECNTFGRIVKVNVDQPGYGFTETPIIRVVSPPPGPELIFPEEDPNVVVDSTSGPTSSSSVPTSSGSTPNQRKPIRTGRINPGPTGTNFEAVPLFEVVRDPVEALTGGITEDKLIQVTDLVGLKRTGYYNGRAYYGAVFYKNGIRYAGYYETAGPLIQIYDTLQESIDGKRTTPPSAIQRQGTDISSNNPRLNLPNTPDNLI